MNDNNETTGFLSSACYVQLDTVFEDKAHILVFMHIIPLFLARPSICYFP